MSSQPTAQEMASSAQKQERPAKRTKIRLACQECRDRKIRCDGVRPCNSCCRKNLPPESCIYSEPGSEIAHSYVQSLETRIRELEVRGASAVAQALLQQDDAQESSMLSAQENIRKPFHASSSNTVYKDPSSHLADHDCVPLQGRDGTRQCVPVTCSSGDVMGNSHWPVHHDAFEDVTPSRRSYDVAPGQQHPESFERGHLSQGHPTTGLESLPRVSLASTNGPRSTSDCDANHQSSPTESVFLPEKPLASAMGATEGTLPSAKSTGSVFLGPSSAAAFMNMIRRHPNKRKRSEVGVTSSTSGATHTSWGRATAEIEAVRKLMEEIVLPPRRIADGHLNSYWRHVHPLYPILHRPTFLERYRKVWTQDTERSQSCETEYTLRAFYSTLNVVLALGCTYTTDMNPSPHINGQAVVYYNRSQQLITQESPDFGSLQLVQALILSAQYLQSSNNVNRTWVAVGLAIRVAQGIGIHYDDPQESQAEREERRRTWWCCVLMDRVLSMTFGRPIMASSSLVVPLPLAIDDEHLSMERNSSSQPVFGVSPSKIAFFVCALDLSSILVDILKCFYTARSEQRELESDGFHIPDCDPVLNLDNRLEQWYAKLPGYLRHGSTATLYEHQNVFETQAVTLHCRYLHLKILLFRPITVDLAQSRYLAAKTTAGQSILKQAFAVACVESSITAAQDIIGVIVGGRATGVVPVWWYSVFYLYTAGTVLLAALLTPTLRQAQLKNTTDLNTSWELCIGALSHLAEEKGGFAKSCLLTLQSALDSALLEMRAGGDEQHDPDATPRDIALPQSTSADYDLELLSSDYFNLNGTTLASAACLESWWPNNSIEWLNSFPLTVDNGSPEDLESLFSC